MGAGCLSQLLSSSSCEEPVGLSRHERVYIWLLLLVSLMSDAMCKGNGTLLMTMTCYTVQNQRFLRDSNAEKACWVVDMGGGSLVQVLTSETKIW